MDEELARSFKNPKLFPIFVGIVAFGSGLGLGYILGRRTRRQIHEVPTNIDFSHDEVEQVISVAERSVDVEVNRIMKRVKEIIEIKEPDDPVPRENGRELVFAPTSEEWNYDEEVKHRSPSQPYVIHRDEFFADEMDFVQSTLTYYSGDNILVDEDDTPIYNHETIVGEMLFGHGSGDPNVFYVRNEKRQAEYEILYDPGLYSVEILGIQIENNERAKDVKDIKHSAANRRFRME